MKSWAALFSTRLPRSRGDRPRSPGGVSCVALAPPLARGSTRRRSLCGRLGRGSPARAGIDPPRGCSPAPATWLPRSRGGSTPDPDRPGRSRRGSPARAGIDPRSPERYIRQRRLPRSRGDRPLPRWLPRCASEAPPLARGSTQSARRGAGGVVGSPARAGIDPWDRCTCLPAPWLPRSRGDRPERKARGPVIFWAPPLARGSTLERRTRCAHADGSPARAGIDPLPSVTASWISRLPRSRGDRPRMSVAAGRTGQAPPLARGSTRGSTLREVRGLGSPARAGIDPLHVFEVLVGERLPRSRGDRPGKRGGRWQAVEAPPLARGSTPAFVHRRRLHRGSPARAGIDPRGHPRDAREPGLPRSRGDRPWSRNGPPNHV